MGQGGILSPFLWNILIDDILRLNFNFSFKIIGYADDITIATDHKLPSVAIKNLQHVLETVNQLLLARRLQLNCVKSKLMIFSKKESDQSNLHLSLNGQQINASQATTFLGLTLHYRLRWDTHVDAKCLSAKRAFMKFHNIARNIWGRYSKRMAYIYRSIAEPIVAYACSVWISYLVTKRGAQKLSTFQRVIARKITMALNTTSTDAMVLLSNTTPISLRLHEIAAREYLKLKHRLSFAPSTARTICGKLHLAADLPPSLDTSSTPLSKPTSLGKSLRDKGTG